MFHFNYSRLSELLVSDETRPRLPAESVWSVKSYLFISPSQPLPHWEDLRIPSWYLAPVSSASLWDICETQVVLCSQHSSIWSPGIDCQGEEEFAQEPYILQALTAAQWDCILAWLKMPFAKSGFNFCISANAVKVKRIRPSFSR